MATSTISSSSCDNSVPAQSKEHALDAPNLEQVQKANQALCVPVNASKDGAHSPNVQKQQSTKKPSIAVPPPPKPAGSVMTLRELEADLFNAIAPSRLDGPPSPPTGISLQDFSLLGGGSFVNNSGSPPAGAINNYFATGKGWNRGIDVFASDPSYYRSSPSSSGLNQVFPNKASHLSPEPYLPLQRQFGGSTFGKGPEQDKAGNPDVGFTSVTLASKQASHQIGSGSVCSASISGSPTAHSPFYCASNASVGGRQVAEFQVSSFAPPDWKNRH